MTERCPSQPNPRSSFRRPLQVAQPDFEAARDYWLRWIALSARQHKEIAAGIALVVVLVIAGSIVAIRRRRAA